MKIENHHTRDDGIVITASAGQFKVQALGPRVIRVVFTHRPTFGSDSSLMLLDGLDRTAPAINRTDDALVLSTTALRLSIDLDSGAFSWLDGSGDLLVREPHDRAETKVLQEVDVIRTVFDQTTEITTVRGVDGERSVVDAISTTVDRQAYSTKLRLEFSDGEAIYGLGQHEEGILNYRGHRQHLYQQNMKIVAPMIVSSRGYAMLWDSQSLATFHDDQDGTYFWTEIDDEMDFLVIAGPEFDDIVGELRRLTGDAPMLPRWALGYIQSKDRYTSGSELVDVVKEFRSRQLPLDCIVQDWQHWPDGQWGQKSFDPARFPDPAGLLNELHELNTRLMVSIWPNMHGDGANQQEFRQQGHLLGDDSTYDAFDPEARDRYWQQVDAGYTRHGVDAYWADCTEPFEGDWKGTVEPEPWQRLMINTGELKKYIDPERMNAYSLLHSAGLYEGQRRSETGKRAFVLTRSGFIGQQRYSAVNWSGDTSATWTTLRRQIADGLNLCVTGTPYWSFDIGAYFVTPGELWFWRGDFAEGCDDLGYRELYVRWLQLGAFLPVFRSHGRCTPREPWRFGEPGDRTYDTIAAFLRLRYRLLPYLYSINGWTTQRRYTPFRSLSFDFRGDPGALEIADQFMLGPALLVCPVLKPMYYGPDSEPLTGVEESRDVYLPAGSDWYDFWTGELHSGGRTIRAAAPLERLPLFVRAGSILPLASPTEHTDQDPFGQLEIRIYPGADGAFDLYEDAGDGYGYEQGEFAFTPLRWTDSTRSLVVDARIGEFPGIPEKRSLTLVVVSEEDGIGPYSSSQGIKADYAGKAIHVQVD